MNVSRFRRVSPAHLALIVAGILVFFAAIGAAILAAHWPFSRDAVIARISKDTGMNVVIGRFETRYFPPGFNAGQVTVKDRQSGASVLTAQTFRIRANYPGLLRGHLSRIDLDGFHLIAGKAHLAPESNSESLDVSTFNAQNGSVEIVSSTPGAQPFRFNIRQLVLHGVGGSHPKFELVAIAIKPPDQFRASGTLDGLSPDSGIAGHFAFSGVDLGVFGGISGTLAASGQISGSLRRLRWNGTAGVPDFHVADSAHRVDLKSAFTFFLNTADASADLAKVETTFNKTTIVAHGRIAAEQPGAGKTLRLAATAQQSRVEDLLTLVSSEPRPGMTGAIRFNANAVLPPSKEPFLRRVKLDGGFEISSALFTNPKTQSPLNYLSESSHDASRAQERRDPEQIPATIHGNVRDAEAIARLDNIRYSMPGVDASLNGTFDLIGKAVLLDGVLTTTGELPDATSAFKAVILSLARPLFGIHKKNKDTIVAFTIAGTTKRPVLSLGHSKLARDAQRLAHR